MRGSAGDQSLNGFFQGHSSYVLRECKDKIVGGNLISIVEKQPYRDEIPYVTTQNFKENSSSLNKTLMQGSR